MSTNGPKGRENVNISNANANTSNPDVREGKERVNISRGSQRLKGKAMITVECSSRGCEPERKWVVSVCKG